MPPRQRQAPASLPEVAETGDRLATLKALRDVIARQLGDSSVAARDVASLAGRLQAVLTEIAELTPAVETKGTPLDELNARRTARGAAPARVARPARSGPD